MALLCFEDFSPGSVREFGAYAVTREEIVAFAREFDPQPFHLDDTAAAASLLGGLAASGWHTLSILMRLYCDEWALRSTSMGSPGVQEARWLAPVRPGDTLSARMRIEDARASRSRPDMGLLTIFSEVLNQTGASVATARHVNMLGRRDRTIVSGAHKDHASHPFESARSSPPAGGQAEADASAGLFGYFDDVVLGKTIDLGSHLFREDDMLRFARAYDPQPFHVDDAAAARSHFGRLAASGWHTASAFMRRLVDTREESTQRALMRGETPLPGGPSPGFRDLLWLTPVHAGDLLTYSTTLIEKRATRKPGWGLVTSHNVGLNQRGFKAFEFTGTVFYPMRDPSAHTP